MNRLERALRDHRNGINAIDRAVLGNLLNEYEQVMTRLNPQIELLVQEIQGRDYASLTQLLRVTRMQELRRQIMAEMDALAAKTGEITRIGQVRAINQAIDGAQTITEASVAGNPATFMTSYNRLNPIAVQDLIGATQAGPLQELLASFGETVERAMLTALTDGIALGTNPRGIADIIRKSTDIGRNRALTIARTEVLRAHRSATLQQFQANADILKGWIWLSAKQTRTCAACLAMDGTFHELDETMASHPNCRCTMRPALKNAPMRKVKTGKQWLDAQSPDAQDAVLGKAGGAAYRAGDVELSDFVKVTESADWGKTTTDGGVAFAKMNAARRSQLSSVPTLKDAKRIVESANKGGVFKRKLEDGEFEKLVPFEVRQDYADKTNNDDFEIRRIEIKNLIGEAENYDPERVLAFVNEQIDPAIGPSILRYAGENYIMDGHHRILSRVVRGEKTAVVRVYDMGDKRAENDDWLFPKKKRRAA